MGMPLAELARIFSVVTLKESVVLFLIGPG